MALSGESLPVTREIARWIANPAVDPVTPAASLRATHAAIDWFAVAIAGSQEPVVEALLNQQKNESGRGYLIGHLQQLPMPFAALINGTASHAVDYDDVNRRMRGHPTVTILPALLALAQERSCSGKAVIEALVRGTEVAAIVGEMLGETHYTMGFHNTATVGCIGAAAACCSLLGLDEQHSLMAIGLATTQAAGLRAMFGSMAKPLHAGRAAMSGLLAATWAEAGVTAATDALESAKGLGATQSKSFQIKVIRADSSQSFAIEENLFKYHAACYYTHAALDTTRQAMQEFGGRLDDVSLVEIDLHNSLDNVCCIESPGDGLAVKFSLQHLVAMVLAGWDTADISIYNSDCATDPELVALRSMVRIRSATDLDRMQSRVRVQFTNGSISEYHGDAGQVEVDDEIQTERLRAKFDALVSPLLGTQVTHQLHQHLATISDCDRVDDLMKTTRLTHV